MKAIYILDQYSSALWRSQHIINKYREVADKRQAVYDELSRLDSELRKIDEERKVAIQEEQELRFKLEALLEKGV